MTMVQGHTSISFLKHCHGFSEAKNGNLDAAKTVVSKCIKQNLLQNLQNNYPNAMLLPVLGRNQLPYALAKTVGLKIWQNVFLQKNCHRKSLNAMQRLLHKPAFYGHIKKGADYIIVDDVITQGGTVSALRGFITSRGGKVVAVVALAYAEGSRTIVPTSKNVENFRRKFGIPLIKLLQKLGITSIYDLTDSQIKYLMRFSSVAGIEKKITRLSCEPPQSVPLQPQYLHTAYCKHFPQPS